MTRFILLVTVVLAPMFCVIGSRNAAAQQARLLPLTGTIGGPFTAEGSDTACGGGTYALTRSADFHSITGVSVESFQAGDEVFSGSGTFPPGAVPIDPERGSFEVYFPGREPGQEITVSGHFALGQEYDPAFALAGISFSVSPSMCSQLGLGPPVPGGGGVPDTGLATSHERNTPAFLMALVLAGAGSGALAVASSRRLRGP